MSKDSKQRGLLATDYRGDLLRKMGTMRTPSELSESISVPPDLAAAMATGRPELLRIVQPRALTVEECRAIYHAMAVLIETNMLLVAHAEEVQKIADNIERQQRGVQSQLRTLGRFAGFRDQSETEDAE